MLKWTRGVSMALAVIAIVVLAAVNVGGAALPGGKAGGDVARNATRMLEEGRQIFRYESFGDEAFWSDALLLDKAIAGAANGGRGGGVPPKTALSVGLKVDAQALPKDLVAKIK